MAHEVVRTWAEAGRLDPSSDVLVETPGEWVRGVAGLIELSKEFKQAGLIVTNVGPNGAAARAGIARGDVLLRYDGAELETVARLRELAALGVGRNGVIEASRGDRELQFEVAPGPLAITVSVTLDRMKVLRPVFGVSWRPL